MIYGQLVHQNAAAGWLVKNLISPTNLLVGQLIVGAHNKHRKRRWDKADNTSDPEISQSLQAARLIGITPITLKFGRLLNNPVAEPSAKFRDWRIFNINLPPLRSRTSRELAIKCTFCCPACRTTLIATRFWVVMICPIIKCLTVLRVFFYFVWFVFIHHNFQFYFELCTYCNILHIYLSQNLNFVKYLLFYMKLLNYLFFNMFGSVLECCELTGVSLL